MKSMTNKTVYNPYSQDKSFNTFHEITPEEYENMRKYLENLHKK